MPPTTTTRNFVALQKNGEVFMFFYGDDEIEAVIRTLARFAANPELNFTWTDASLLIHDIIGLPDGAQVRTPM